MRCHFFSLPLVYVEAKSERRIKAFQKLRCYAPYPRCAVGPLHLTTQICLKGGCPQRVS